MVSGNKNTKKADNATKKSIAALAPKSYSDPFGSFSNGVYTPNLSATQKQTLADTQTGIGNATQALQKPFSLEDYYDNPFYQNTADLFSQPVMRQYEQDKKNLDNQLNARNQIGGSYDAFSNSLLGQNRDYNLNQAQLQGRAASADAYNQSYQNMLAQLQGLTNSQMAQQQYMYQPFNNYLSYQNAMTPLQQGVSNAYNQQANFYQNQAQRYDGFTNQANNMMGTIQNAYRTMWEPVAAPVRAVAPLLGGGNSGQAAQLAKIMGGV